MTRLLVVDNYDSFVYNLAQYLGEMGAEVIVERNDSERIGELCDRVDGFVISPGPGHPRTTRGSLEIIRNEGYGHPVLGVCLGHQAIAYVYGAHIGRARRVMHGKTDRIYHSSDHLLEGVPSPVQATRYHSLVVEREGFPERLQVVATSGDGEIMALRVRGKDIYGLQFHPESVMTEGGRTILSNFMRRCCD